MPIYMTAQYQVHPSKIEKIKKSIRPLVEHVKSHEPLTTIYIAQQQILNPVIHRSNDHYFLSLIDSQKLI